MRQALVAMALLVLSFLSPDKTIASTLAEKLDQCIASLYTSEYAAEGNKLFNLGQRCPALDGLYTKLSLAHLDPPLGEKISLNQLLDIKHALESMGWQTIPRGNLDFAGLDSLLKDTLESPDPTDKEKGEPGLWEQFTIWLNDQWKQFTGWLKEKLNPEQDSGVYNKLLEWLSTDLPDWVAEFFLKGSILLLLLMALLFIVNELRVASLANAFHRATSRFKHKSQLKAMLREKRMPTWSDIGNMPPSQQVIALLHYALSFLTKRHILLEQPSKTNLEYLEILKETAPHYATPFAELVKWADVSLYGQDPITPSQSHQLRESIKSMQQLLQPS